MVRILEANAALSDCTARLPFRFGIVTMRGAPLCVVRVVVETASGRVEGYASDLLVPKWFEKDPDRSVAGSWKVLTDGIAGACEAATGNASAMTVFDHWHRLYDERVMGWGGPRSWRLVLGHGVSLVERALIDAVCRARGQPFHLTFRDGALGFDAPRLGVTGVGIEAVVRAEPLSVVRVRHTVGLIDPLDGADGETPRPADDLPVTLSEAIRAYGLTHFKIKVSGAVDTDLERLTRIARVLQGECRVPPVCTLDGNEQFDSIETLRTLLARMRERPRTAWLRERIVVIEQPLSRARTLCPDTNEGLRELGEEIPVIIDEADLDPAAFPDAVAVGYRGVSVKNGKGVFRAVANAMRCRVSEGRLMQTSEDLTNVPLLALQQDIVTASTLGLDHLERNGHHYFAGLDHLPAVEREAAAQRHPDLYGEDGRRLQIQEGRLHVGSLHSTHGYGYDGPVAFDERTSLATWSPDDLLARTTA